MGPHPCFLRYNISEAAPARIRGTLVSIYQLAIVIGINLIYFVNYGIATSGSDIWNMEYGWRYMLGSEILPALLFFILLFTVPESPRWLLKKGDTSKAEDILVKINGANAENIKKEIISTLNVEKGNISDLFGKKYRKALIIGIVLALFSQITGINAIIYFAPEIFKSVGFGVESAFLQTILIGVVNTVFTFVALYAIDRLGRRKLLLFGLSGMIFCLIGTIYCFYYEINSGPWLVLCIVGFVGSFATSLGPIPWVLISEIFPTKTRGVAMSLCTLVLWIGVILITQLTPILIEKTGGAVTFLIFLINTIFLALFAWRYIPETKNRSLEEIEKSWDLK